MKESFVMMKISVCFVRVTVTRHCVHINTITYPGTVASVIFL